ncbi:MAG: YciI family protein [Thermoleophilaceae bacterium]
MRAIVLVKASPESEGGEMPSEEELTEMTEFNEELVKAGVMLAGEGLHPSSKGVRVAFSGTDREVIEGPFAETKELVAGYWVWQVKSMDEAVEWLKRAPFQDGQVEIRPIFESDDFGDELTPELREREAKMRDLTGGGG